MMFTIDPNSDVALYEQIAASVRREIATHKLSRGDRLPPAKEVAASLDINLHTVLRAYQDLRDEGLIDLRRGRGAVVTGSEPAGTARLTTLIRELSKEARRQGLARKDLLEMMDKEYRNG